MTFPEYFSLQLLSSNEKFVDAKDAFNCMTAHFDFFDSLFKKKSQQYGLYIQAGTYPRVEDGKKMNIADFYFPDGSRVSQPKIHITPTESQTFGTVGGDDLKLIETDFGKVAILICYDIEFPEISRLLVDAGVTLLIVPFCTDTKEGYLRVRHSAHARAIENQIYVVLTGACGHLENVPGIDLHYAQSCILTPLDYHFPDNGIKNQAEINCEQLVHSRINFKDLEKAREAGSVRNLSDRRLDLYSISSSVQITEQFSKKK